MKGGMIFKHLEKDKFLVTNTGEGKNINNTVVKFALKDLKDVLSSYGVDIKRKKKQELIEDFIKLSMNMPTESKPVPPRKPRTKKVKDAEPEMIDMEFRPKITREMRLALERAKEKPEEMMDMEYRPKITREMRLALERAKEKPKEEPSAKPVLYEPPKLSPELERAVDPDRLSQLLPIRSEREDELLEMEEDELKDIINDNDIKVKKEDKQSMINAILKKEKIVKGTILPEEIYDDLVTQHNILSLKNSKGDRSIYVMYRKLEADKAKVAQMRKKPDRDTSAEMFEDLKIKRLMERISDIEEILLKDITKGKKGDVKVAKPEPIEEMMDMEYRPKITREMRLALERAKDKPKTKSKEDNDDDIFKPKYGHAFTELLERMKVLKDDKSFDNPIVDIDREYTLFKMKRPELVKVAKSYKIKGNIKVNDMINAILKAEGLPRRIDTGNKEEDEADYNRLQTKNEAISYSRDKTNKTKIKSYDELIEMIKDYIRNPEDNLLKRQARRQKIEFHIERALSLREGRMTGRGKKGGSISAKDLKGLHASSYKEEPEEQVGEWVLDESISKPTARVYFNASKNQAIVVHRGTEGTVKDWANNAFFVAGLSPLTQRYKDSKEVQEKAEAKYSDVLTTGHSQGSNYTKLAKNKKGIIDVNPSSFLQSTEGTTVRSASDPVSALRGIANMFSKKGKENITTSAKANPLDAHSINILDELGDKELGTGLTKYLKGLHSKKGKGRFEDFFKKTLPSVLVKKGIPLAMSIGASSLGSIGGPITGLVAGEVGAKAGQLLADDISKKAGLGLTRRLKSLGR
jgi:hypothetical protein